MATDTRRTDTRYELLQQVLVEREQLAERMTSEIRREIPGYGSVTPAEMVPGVVANMGLIMTILQESRSLEPTEVAALEEHGRLRATQGVPVEDLLHAWRLSVAMMVQELIRLGRERTVPDSMLLELAVDLHATSDQAMLANTRGHREQELELAGIERDRRADLVRQVLHGSLSLAAIRVQANVYGLDLERRYHAIRARPTDALTLIELERRLGLARGVGRPHGLAAILDGDLVGFIDDPPRIELDTQIGIGHPAPIDGLEGSFRAASRAAATAAAYGLRGVFDLERLGARAAVVDDSELGRHLVRRYMEPLAVAGEMAETLAGTTERFLANGMRVEATAKELFLHPNTLRYRLKRFEELTGCDLRDPRCALEVWWALQRARLDRHGAAADPSHM